MTNEWRDMILGRLKAKKIVGAKTMVEALYLIGNSERWDWFEYIINNMIVTNKAFAKGLAMAYTMGSVDGDSDALWYFEQAQIKHLCTHKERAYLNNLKDVVTIYRGCHKIEMQTHHYGLSWSIDRGVAEFFAFRGRHFASCDGVVLSTKVDKSRLLALFLERGEFETIVDIGEPDNIEIVTNTPTIFYDNFIKQKQASQNKMFLKNWQGQNAIKP